MIGEVIGPYIFLSRVGESDMYIVLNLDLQDWQYYIDSRRDNFI